MFNFFIGSQADLLFKWLSHFSRIASLSVKSIKKVLDSRRNLSLDIKPMQTLQPRATP